MSEIFKYDVDADGVATIAWDLPGRSMNVLTLDGGGPVQRYAFAFPLFEDLLEGID